jgi:tRNA/rRNA methyltransferase
VPVGPHITDFVSFPLRLVLDMEPDGESPEAAATRAERRAWLAERGYRVIGVRVVDVQASPAAVLDRLAATIGQGGADVPS